MKRLDPESQRGITHLWQDVFGKQQSLASQLPQCFVLNAEIVHDTRTCGSWLASDDIGSGD
jgi:hypothetical protein